MKIAVQISPDGVQTMSEFCLRPDIVLGLLDEISRHRALEPHETDMIEELVSLEVKPFRWNPRLENQLMVASDSPGGITRFARRVGIDKWVAYAKLHRIRARKMRKAAKAQDKG